MDLSLIPFRYPSLTLCFRETIIPSPIFTPTCFNTNQKNTTSNHSKNGLTYLVTINGQEKTLEGYRHVRKLTISEMWHETQFKIIHRAYYPFRINKMWTQLKCNAPGVPYAPPSLGLHSHHYVLGLCTGPHLQNQQNRFWKIIYYVCLATFTQKVLQEVMQPFRYTDWYMKRDLTNSLGNLKVSMSCGQLLDLLLMMSSAMASSVGGASIHHRHDRTHLVWVAWRCALPVQGGGTHGASLIDYSRCSRFTMPPLFLWPLYKSGNSVRFWLHFGDIGHYCICETL